VGAEAVPEEVEEDLGDLVLEDLVDFEGVVIGAVPRALEWEALILGARLLDAQEQIES